MNALGRLFPVAALVLASGYGQEAQPGVKVDVDATKRAAYTVPRTLFGTFLEPIGNSTYNGL